VLAMGDRDLAIVATVDHEQAGVAVGGEPVHA
jgi:hypothetical protein